MFDASIPDGAINSFMLFFLKNHGKSDASKQCRSKDRPWCQGRDPKLLIVDDAYKRNGKQNFPEIHMPYSM